jgi:hypothetical protein
MHRSPPIATMQGMRKQLFVAAAITVLGALVWLRLVFPSHLMVLVTAEMAAPLLMPFLFAAYAFGRKTITGPMLTAFAVLETAAIAVPFWLIKGPAWLGR